MDLLEGRPLPHLRDGKYCEGQRSKSTGYYDRTMLETRPARASVVITPSLLLVYESKEDSFPVSIQIVCTSEPNSNNSLSK